MHLICQSLTLSLRGFVFINALLVLQSIAQLDLPIRANCSKEVFYVVYSVVLYFICYLIGLVKYLVSCVDPRLDFFNHSFSQSGACI